jgi:hypothetical protein
MKKYILSLTIACALTSALSAQSIFNTYAYVSDTSAGTDPAWYNLGGAGQSSSFEGANLGSFTTSLWLGGQSGIWSNGQQVEYSRLNYSITGAATATGAVAYSFQYYEGPAGSNNDQWGTDVNGANSSDASIDLITTYSLAAGSYNIAVWAEGQTKSGNLVYDSNNSNNYNATFTVAPIPEASTYALYAGMLGLITVMLRRRNA